ncbi:zinc ribbon domain-containing protein [Brenneria populi subsp. brevivirga]|uniref:zinc ribbon domain-containing protein n=1 Tax=Brenneria populi TaxID=1505588 RepID=UPI002E16D7D7|nr:zinc ribbon domain-containing protein [Brenneria populi subsp. brevivirga]
MKIIGYVAIAIGLIFAVSALLMDVSVITDNGYRVNNIGLMSSRQNYMIFGGFIAIAGLIVVIFSDRIRTSFTATKCPYCAEEISPDAIKCKHCGSDVTPAKLADRQPSDTVDEGRLDNVNVKYILCGVVVVFAVIIATIVMYKP